MVFFIKKIYIFDEDDANGVIDCGSMIKSILQAFYIQ